MIQEYNCKLLLWVALSLRQEVLLAMKKTILAVGDATMDVLLNVPYAPHGGRFVNSKDRYMFTPGGGGAYTAVAARRCGPDVVLCARVGDDEQGNRLVSHLKEADVNTAYIAKDSINQTGLAVYLLEEYGLGGKVTYGGANKKLNCANVEAAFACYPDLFTASLQQDMEVLKYAADLTRERNVPFVLDATGAYENCRLSGLIGVDILIASEEAAENLTGIRPDSTDNCLRVCISICDKLPLRFVVLKLGRRGAYIYDGKYCELLMAPDLENIDETAEHECFVGSFCARFVRDYDVFQATRYALAASAIAASRVGGFASIPTDDDVANIL